MDKPEIYKVSTVKAYRRKLAAAQQAEMLRAAAGPMVATRRSASGLPTDAVDFPAIRVVGDMWRIVSSPRARLGV